MSAEQEQVLWHLTKKSSRAVLRGNFFKLRHHFLLISAKHHHAVGLFLCQLMQNMVEYNHARFYVI